jgi:hypothetical protein
MPSKIFYIHFEPAFDTKATFSFRYISLPYSFASTRQPTCRSSSIRGRKASNKISVRPRLHRQPMAERHGGMLPIPTIPPPIAANRNAFATSISNLQSGQQQS